MRVVSMGYQMPFPGRYVSVGTLVSHCINMPHCIYYMSHYILLHWVRILLFWVCIIVCLRFIVLGTYYFMFAFYCIVLFTFL
jgi:hypothetical protein